MPMPDYPTTLPMPDTGTLSGQVDEGLLRSEVPSARANHRIGFNSPRTELSMTFSMINDTYDTWLTWVKANAYDWFNMPIVATNTPTGITSTQRVRFISDIQYNKRGDNWLSVTVAVETVPGDYGQ